MLVVSGPAGDLPQQMRLVGAHGADKYQRLEIVDGDRPADFSKTIAARYIVCLDMAADLGSLCNCRARVDYNSEPP